jgi:hypothetical protein
MPKTVAGHLTGVLSGSRNPQIRYYNKLNNWKYKVGLEYKTAHLNQPDTLGAVSRIVIPALVSQFSFGGKWGQAGAGAMLKPNRVQFTGDPKKAETIIAWGFMFAAKFHFAKSSKITLGGVSGTGMGSFIADYTYSTPIDLIYNPQTMSFENISIYGSFFSYTIDWSKTFSSAIAGGYNHAIDKNNLEGLSFNHSYKALINLFYTPQKVKGLTAGVEFLYAERFNIDATQNRAFRASFIIMFDI